MANINVATLTATLKANTGQFQAAMGGASKSAQTTNTRMLGLGKTMLRTTGIFAGLATVGAVFRAAGTEVVGFDKNMRNVNSLAQLSEKDFRNLERQVAKLSGKTAKAPSELADGLYDLVSSGFKASDAVKVLAASARAGTAGLTSTKVAAGAVAGAINAYGLRAEDASRVSDILFRTVDQGVITFEELAQGIGPVLPVARKLGQTLDQVGAFTATLTKAGIPAAEAFTYQKGAMVALIKPTEELQKVFKKLGVQSGGELVKKFGSVQGALEAISKAVGGNETAMAALFPEIRGMTAAFGVTSQKAKDAKRDLDALSNSTGATDKALAEQSKSISYWANLVAAVLKSKVVLAWIEANEFVANNSKAIATAFEIIGTAMEVVGHTIAETLAGIIAVLRGALDMIRGVVTVFAGLVTGDFGKMWDGIKQIFRGAASVVLGIVRAMTAPLRETLARIGVDITSATSSAWNFARSVVIGAVNAIVGFVAALPGRLVSALSSMASAIGGMAAAAWRGFRDRVVSGATSAVEFVQGLPGKIRGALGNLGGLLYDAGRALIQGLINGIASKAGELIGKVRGLLSQARNLLPFSEPKDPSSPLRGLSKSGAALVGNLAKGVASSSALTDAMRGQGVTVGAPAGSGVFAGAASRGTAGGGNHYSISVSTLDAQVGATAVVRMIDEFERRNGPRYARA